jgi:hypothetical protein
MIFAAISAQNKARNTGSEYFTTFPRVVSANPGALLSIARNTQFSAMTPKTTRSKCGWKHARIAIFRIGFSAVNTPRDFSINTVCDWKTVAVVGIARVGDGVQVGDAFVRWVRSRSALANGRAKNQNRRSVVILSGMAGGKRV